MHTPAGGRRKAGWMGGGGREDEREGIVERELMVVEDLGRVTMRVEWTYTREWVKRDSSVCVCVCVYVCARACVVCMCVCVCEGEYIHAMHLAEEYRSWHLLLAAGL